MRTKVAAVLLLVLALICISAGMQAAQAHATAMPAPSRLPVTGSGGGTPLIGALALAGGLLVLALAGIGVDVRKE